MYRVAFNPDLPVVVTGTPVQTPDGPRLICNGQAFAMDAPLPWRDLGISVRDLYALWCAALIAFVEPVVMAVKGEDTKLHVTPGPRVEVETPKQRRKRKPSPDDLTDDELERLTRPE